VEKKKKKGNTKPRAFTEFEKAERAENSVNGPGHWQGKTE